MKRPAVAFTPLEIRFLTGLALLAALAAAPAALAYTSPGSPTGYVNDFAHVLSDRAKQALESELAEFEKTTSNQIAVAIVPSMGGDYVENYAVKLFEEWGVGGKDRDNGVLLLLSIEERKMRIEVGYGLEGALPDSIAQSILDNEMTPRLKAGDYDGAVTAGVQAILQVTRREYAPRASSGLATLFSQNAEALFIFGLIALQFLGALLARSRSWWAGGVVGFFGGLGAWWLLALSLALALPIAIALILLGLLLDYIVSNAYQKAKSSGVNPPWWIGGGRGGGFGGFGGFGGGSSGGGGASGGY